jgi:hypothetical protein
MKFWMLIATHLPQLGSDYALARFHIQRVRLRPVHHRYDERDVGLFYCRLLHTLTISVLSSTFL